MNTRAKCPRCDEGWVPCLYAHRPGNMSGLPENCYPDESEVEEIGECEECGAGDWTEAEMEAMGQEAAENYDPYDGCEDDRND